MISIKELYWIAGFLEGEGSFCRCGNTIRVSAGQVQREPLDRLYSLVGGYIHPRKPNLSRPNQQAFWAWYLDSVSSAALMMTLYPLMSPKRQEEIISTLNWWKATRRIRKVNDTFCTRGHDMRIAENIYIDPKWGYKHCRLCRQENNAGSYRERKTSRIIGVVEDDIFA